ncbi:hypothetical protein C1H76_0669 [Elsinoe australis]|uniref:F-box domain-containing protein n=1 Tax=Elsinoe australis TaxID=40998 RepID=A0A4U7BA67_9PEZI|nr:hypothetical protein C1H76_0669 [Elsinoe australis]
MASDDQSRIYSTLYGPFKLSYDAQKGHYEKGFDAKRNVYRQVLTLEASMPFKLFLSKHGLDFSVRPGPRDHFNLHDLPTEVRTMILRLVLSPPNSSLGILHVNKATHKEAEAILYQENTIDLSSTTICRAWFKKVKRKAPLVRHLSVGIWYANSGISAAASLSKFDNLESLVLPITYDAEGSPGADVKRMYEGLTEFFDGRGMNKADVEKSLGIIRFGRCDGHRGSQKYQPCKSFKKDGKLVGVSGCDAWPLLRDMALADAVTEEGADEED